MLSEPAPADEIVFLLLGSLQSFRNGLDDDPRLLGPPPPPDRVIERISDSITLNVSDFQVRS